MLLTTDNIIKFSGVVIACVSIITGLHEYSINNDREFRKNYFTRQTEVYEEILDDLGSISSSVGDTSKILEFQITEVHFEKLYYGRINLYQDKTIELQLDKLFDMISELKDNYNLRTNVPSIRIEIKNKSDRIQDKIYDLAEACKTSLENTYKVTDPDLYH